MVSFSVINPTGEFNVKQVMGKQSNESSFATLKTQPFPGCLGLPFGVKGRRQAQGAWGLNLYLPSAPPCVLCAAGVQWQSYRFGGGGGAATTLSLVKPCKDVSTAQATNGNDLPSAASISRRSFVLLFLPCITVFPANSFIDQGVKEGRELTFAVLSAERGMLALQPHEWRKKKNEIALLPFCRVVINLANGEGGSFLKPRAWGITHAMTLNVSIDVSE